MSNIPSSAMPHAGGQSTTGNDASSGSTTSFQSQGSQSSGGSGSSSADADGSQRTRRRDAVLEKARENKTGIAIGVVGAAAAAAIPFILSKRNKSKEASFPGRVDNRAEADANSASTGKTGY